MLVKYTKANIHDAYGMKLKPGVNDVDPKLWADAAKDSEIQAMLDDGAIVLLEQDNGDSTKAPAKVTSLKGFGEKKALNIIKDTFDYEMLQLWSADEQRQNVKVALAKQLADLETHKKEVQEKQSKESDKK